MKARKLYYFVGIFFSCLLIYSCGSGSGDGGETSNAAPTVIPLKTSTIKQLTPGDAWSYNVTGTVSFGNDGSNVTGTVDYWILSTTKQSPITGHNSLDLYFSETLTMFSETSFGNGHTYFLQGDYGSLFIFGEDVGFGDTWVISPQDGYYLSLLSPIAIGQTLGGPISYGDGSSGTIANSVDAIETVSTKAGTFEAYRISEYYHYKYVNGDELVTNSTVWFVPGLGMSIKEIANSDYYSGGLYQFSMNLTFTLSNTTVVY